MGAGAAGRGCGGDGAVDGAFVARRIRREPGDLVATSTLDPHRPSWGRGRTRHSWHRPGDTGHGDGGQKKVDAAGDDRQLASGVGRLEPALQDVVMAASIGNRPTGPCCLPTSPWWCPSW